MGLVAASYLGPNTLPILRDLAAYLQASTGVPIVVDGQAHCSAAALAQAEDRCADLIWACGKLSIELLDTQQLAADIVAAPVFAGERGALYHSVIVVRQDGPATLRAAMATRLGVNELLSWSGHLGLRAHLRSAGLVGCFDNVVITGSHLQSVAAVAAGRVDVAAIDHTLWGHICDDPSAADGISSIRVLGRTGDWPAPPLLLSKRIESNLAARLTSALIKLPATAVAGLSGIDPATVADYAVMRD